MTHADRSPLGLAVRLAPGTGPLGTPTTVEVELSNPGADPITVNGRLLVAHGDLGELELEVDGPPDYTNTVEFTVRAGEPGVDDFVNLGPGEAVSGRWRLERYHSVDQPGAYHLTVTYHNEVAQAPDGRPVVVATLCAGASFHRGTPPSRATHGPTTAR